MNLSDLIPEKIDENFLFTDAQKNAVKDGAELKKLHTQLSAHLTSIDLEGDDIQILPDGFHKSIAEMIDEAIPDATILTKSLMFYTSLSAFNKTAEGFISKKLVLNSLKEFLGS